MKGLKLNQSDLALSQKDALSPGEHNLLARTATLECAEVPSLQECAGHLKLLELFVELREGVEQWARNNSMEPDATWRVFVQLAVVRFIHWFRTALRSAIDMESCAPPLDVLMAWHSFMLNPRDYSEFCKAARGDRAGLHGISWEQVVRRSCYYLLVLEEYNADVAKHDLTDLDSSTCKTRQSDVKAAESLTLHSDMLQFLRSATPADQHNIIKCLEEHHDAGAYSPKVQVLLRGYHDMCATDFSCKGFPNPMRVAEGDPGSARSYIKLWQSSKEEP
ncbi:hypothetical protein B0T16DRAFT_497502 [Cercophora newfieldiana]|uniref:Uncharacterized protein n=1 Tax=Cercophora newfieldiana TaxID=92897 RepID=A0AA40CJ39_9PEZI|nr:hypothetical protein B0T16DRAFT_497502 [Cercophora newfieldiana]